MVRIPIVINNGQLQQLQSGDVLSGPTVTDGLLAQTFNLATAGTSAAAAAYSEAVLAYNLAVTGTNASADNTSVTLINDDVVAHMSGTVVYIDADDGAKQARADSMTTAVAVALATGSVAPSQLGTYRLTGILKGQSGLTPGATYYLSPTTAGQMTVTAPTTQGQVVVHVGNAISSTMFKVDIEPPILL